MEKKFAHHHAISRQILLEVADVFETILPNVFAGQFWRQFLLCQKFGMHPDNEQFFVITAIKDSDVPPVWQTFHASPEIIVIQIFAGGRFERIHFTALRVYPRHDMLDRAVLACCVHRLENQKDRPLVLSVKFVLQLGQGGDASR